MTVEFRWTEFGFEIFCAQLTLGTIEATPPPDVAEDVQRWLAPRLEELGRLAKRWPGHSFLATLTRAGNAVLDIDLLPTSDTETWVASIRPTRKGRPPVARTLADSLASASLRFAIRDVITTDGLFISDVGCAVLVDWLPRTFTDTEGRLFTTLLHRPREAMARGLLWALISDRPFSVKALDRHVRGVRSKLKPHAGVLVTVRDFGYRLDIGPRGEQLTFGPLQIDPAARQAWVAGAELDLTRVEFDVLLMLARRPGQTVVTDRLRHAGDGPGISLQMLRRTIMSLRRKLREASSMITTVREIGYRLDPDAAHGADSH